MPVPAVLASLAPSLLPVLLDKLGIKTGNDKEASFDPLVIVGIVIGSLALLVVIISLIIKKK